MYTNVHRCFFNCTLFVHSFLFVFCTFYYFCIRFLNNKKYWDNAKLQEFE